MTQRNPVVEEDLGVIAESSIPWQALAGKTVLITGANGFLPAYMVECILYLNEKDPSFRAKVIGVVRDAKRGNERFSPYLNRGDFKLLVHDASERFSVDGPVDFIVHAASQASPKYYAIDPVGTLAPNIFGTHYLLELARDKKSEAFLFFSSGEVYGLLDFPASEKDFGYVDPTMIRSCYTESKRMGETICISWHHQYGVPARIVRPFHTYGPGMRLDDGRVFSDFVSDIVHGRDIIIKSDGSAIRPYCYLSDATRAFFTVLLEGISGEAYNVGNDRAEANIWELANTLVALYPEKKINIVHQPHEHTSTAYLQSPIKRNCPDTTKIRALGWQPNYSISDGFRRTIESYLVDRGVAPDQTFSVHPKPGQLEQRGDFRL